MKKLKMIALWIFTLSLLAPLSAQTEQKESLLYQAVLRDADGFILPNAPVKVVFSIYIDNIDNIAYVEENQTVTDALGQFQLMIGSNLATVGNFATLPFDKMLLLGVSINGESTPITPFYAVPKALHAVQASTLSGKTFSDIEVSDSNFWSSKKISSLSLNSSTDNTHILNVNNPHQVTVAQLGLENVDNTPDEDKPVSRPAQTAIGKEEAIRKTEDVRILDSLLKHKENVNNPHQVTAAQVGLSNVNNTSDMHKPVSIPMSDSLALLRLQSSEDVEKLMDSLRIESSFRQKEDLRILDSLLKHKDNVGNPHQITAVQVGLSNVDNTSDMSKPVSIPMSDSLALLRLQSFEKFDNLMDSLRIESLFRYKEDLRILDSIQNIQQIVENISIDFCLVSDALSGIYTSAIPLYSLSRPDTIGLFTNPLLKILKLSSATDLFSELQLSNQIKKSYRSRVMAYNIDDVVEKLLYIPASTAAVDVYVDNYRLSAPATYTVYHILIFEVEFYYLGPDETPKMYVTLIRE